METFKLSNDPQFAEKLEAIVGLYLRDLTQHRLKRGVFRDVEELINALDEYVDRHNGQPKPFIWTASAKDILAKVKRARKALNNFNPSDALH